jgi:predicted nucleic acid-binding Zn ribbon protein
MRAISMEQAGIGLDEIVAKSRRKLPAFETPVIAWPIVCGSVVSERTRATGFRDGVLTVEVANAGWKSEVQRLAAQSLAGINRDTPDAVRRIEFVVASSEIANAESSPES